MKFLALAAATLIFALPSLAQPAILYEPLTCDTIYDDPSLSLYDVLCSTGTHGFISMGYSTLGSLPTFPDVGGAYTVTGYDSPACGTCYNITYPITSISIYILAVDYAAEGFVISEEAMNRLTNGSAVELGKIEVLSFEVEKSFCGL